VRELPSALPHGALVKGGGAGVVVKVVIAFVSSILFHSDACLRRLVLRLLVVIDSFFVSGGFGVAGRAAVDGPRRSLLRDMDVEVR
jgi:hypothetical protein